MCEETTCSSDEGDDAELSLTDERPAFRASVPFPFPVAFALGVGVHRSGFAT